MLFASPSSHRHYASSGLERCNGAFVMNFSGYQPGAHESETRSPWRLIRLSEGVGPVSCGELNSSFSDINLQGWHQAEHDPG